MNFSKTVIPLRIEAGCNKREHWGAKNRRTQMERFCAIAVKPVPLPCVVTLVRIAPRKLDGDNLQNAFKPLRDGIADRLGVDDGSPQVSWKYEQERGRAKEYAVRVELAHG